MQVLMRRINAVSNHKSPRKWDLTPYYRSYLESPKSAVADLANYALGLINMLADNEADALSHFLKVKNTELKYLNNSNVTLQFHSEGAPAHEFFYCVLGIGLIEETIKIIPVLLI